MTKSKRQPLNGEATLNRLENDLFWTFSAIDTTNNYEYVTARWRGYSDAFWWNNVATSDKHQTTTGSNGRKYRINFTTREVTEVE